MQTVRQKRLRRSVARLERSLQHAQEAVQAGNMAAIAKIDFFRQCLQQCIKDRLRGAQFKSVVGHNGLIQVRYLKSSLKFRKS